MTSHPIGHATDDMGFPICRCLACIEKSKIINAQCVARLFKQITREGTDERLERIEREQDYPPYQNGDA